MVYTWWCWQICKGEEVSRAGYRVTGRVRYGDRTRPVFGDVLSDRMRLVATPDASGVNQKTQCSAVQCHEVGHLANGCPNEEMLKLKKEEERLRYVKCFKCRT